MSIKVMTHIWDHSPHTGSDLLMLLAIADHANDEGVAWPSLPTLARKCRVHHRQARRIVKSLEQAGSISISHGQGRGHSSVYTIKGVFQAPFYRNGDMQTPFLEEKGVQGPPFAEIKGGLQDTKGGLQTPPTIIEPPEREEEEKPSDKSLARQPKKATAYSHGFESFWQVYPETRKRGKAQAWQLWQNDHLDTQAEDIIAKVVALRQYDNAFREGFEPEPHRWLKHKRYTDDILTSPPAVIGALVSAKTASSMAASNELIREIQGDDATGQSTVFQRAQRSGRTLLGPVKQG